LEATFDNAHRPVAPQLGRPLEVLAPDLAFAARPTPRNTYASSAESS